VRPAPVAEFGQTNSVSPRGEACGSQGAAGALSPLTPQKAGQA
jgi:hypothetical protein